MRTRGTISLAALAALAVAAAVAIARPGPTPAERFEPLMKDHQKWCTYCRSIRADRIDPEQPFPCIIARGLGRPQPAGP